MKRLSVLLAALILTACAQTKPMPPASVDAAPSTTIACKAERPQICTREYNPVCAIMADGSRKTASTACAACSDEKVTGYTSAPCADAK